MKRLAAGGAEVIAISRDPSKAGEGDVRAELFRNMVKGNLIERTGTADECAQAIMFMIENDFVTGTTIDVDGGWILS